MTPEQRLLQRLEWRWQKYKHKWTEAAVLIQRTYRGRLGRKAAKKETHERLMRMKAKEAYDVASRLAFRGDYEGAMKAVQKSVNFDARFTPAGVLRARLLHKAGEIETSLAECSRVLNLDANDADALFYRSRAYAKLGRWELASQDLNKVVRSRPKSVPAFLLRGYCNIQRQDYESALYDFSRILDIRGEDAVAQDWLRRGLVSGLMHDFLAGDTDITEGLKVRPAPFAVAQAELLTTRGRIYACMREFSMADLDYRKSLEKAPGYKPAVEGLREVIIPFNPMPMLLPSDTSRLMSFESKHPKLGEKGKKKEQRRPDGSGGYT